jgi:pimeloyl-ACP methyl ester carboxylesterase
MAGSSLVAEYPKLKKLLFGGVAVLALIVAVTMFKYTSAKRSVQANRDAESRIIETRAGSIEYAQGGTDGPLVLHLHGSPGGFQTDPLPNVRTLSLSRPGYLRTPLTVGQTAEDQAHAYAALLDALEIDEKVFVYAISGGGPSAYAFAGLYPERVRGLIALAAQSQSMPPEKIQSVLQDDFTAWLSLHALALAGPDAIGELFFSNSRDRALMSESPHLQQDALDLIQSVWPYSLFREGFENDMQALSDIALPLQDIEAPTLIIHGTADTDVGYEQAVYASEQIAGATLLTVDGAEHLSLFLTRRDEVMAAVAAFLADN